MAEKRIVLKKTLGERIKRLAGEKNIPLSQIEVHAGYSQGMLTRWANASEDENFEIFTKLVIIAGILGISVDELLGVAGPRVGVSHMEDLLPCMTSSTREAALQWEETDWKTAGELPQPESEDRALAGAWQAERGRLWFLLTAYCDDLDDLNEPMGFRLYALAGHGIPPQPIPGETAALQALYVAIQLQAAHRSLVNDTVD